MDVRDGYKLTEVGIIPADWHTETIGSFAHITTGSKNTQDRRVAGEYPFFVRSQTVERIDTYSFNGEAVLTAGDGVGTGKVFHYANEKFDFHQRVYKISGFADEIDGYYFYQYFRANFYNRIMQMTAKSSVDSVRKEMIADMPIALPPTKAEQEAIAEALGDADELIQSLEELIAKKRLIKQGAMQELLRPKEGWVATALGEILDYEQPTKYLVTDTEYDDNNQVPVLTAGKTFVLGYTDESFGLFDSLPVIIFDDFTTASKFVDLRFKVKSSAVKILKLRGQNYSLRFAFESMQIIHFPLSGHKRYWISEYQYLEIPVPEYSEQNRIAGQLGDMDAEIAALDSKLTKYKQMKQGMMQVLLTGNIRLV